MVVRLLEKMFYSVLGKRYIERHLLIDLALFVYVVAFIATVYFILN